MLYCVFTYLILDSSNDAIKASEESTSRMLRDMVHWSIFGKRMKCMEVL